jgi:hypothetical protein
MMMDLMHVLGRGGAGNWGGNPPMSGPMPVRAPMPVRGTLAPAPNPTMQARAPQAPQSPFSVGSWLNWRHPNGGF